MIDGMIALWCFFGLVGLMLLSVYFRRLTKRRIEEAYHEVAMQKNTDVRLYELESASLDSLLEIRLNQMFKDFLLVRNFMDGVRKMCGHPIREVVDESTHRRIIAVQNKKCALVWARPDHPVGGYGTGPEYIPAMVIRVLLRRLCHAYWALNQMNALLRDIRLYIMSRLCLPYGTCRDFSVPLLWFEREDRRLYPGIKRCLDARDRIYNLAESRAHPFCRIVLEPVK